MFYKRKSVLTVILCSLFISIIFNYTNSFSTAHCQALSNGIIYESSARHTITSGLTLENIIRFTDSGWLNINVLRADLSNQYIFIDSLSNRESIKKPAAVSNLAKTNGAVAAINASFFNRMPRGECYPDGPFIKSGSIYSASSQYNKYNNSMATFCIDNLGQIIYDYWKTDISLVNDDGTSIPVNNYNKESAYKYRDITIFDRKWSKFTPGNTEYNDLLEVIAEQGKIIEMRRGLQPVEIPENGFAIVARREGADKLISNFTFKDNITFNIRTRPDWKNIKTAVSGSAILIKNGEIPDRFSFNIKGKHPRTAIGNTKDGHELIMVTVDGRQNKSIGLTQSKMASLMLELGAYDALNLDGGGSSTMVTRKPGTNELIVTNSPSGGFERKISTALGIFSIAPPSSLDGLIIDTIDSNVFINTTRSFSVKGYDRFYNPIHINPDKINWEISGIDGYFEGNVLHPTSAGKGIVKATSGNITSEFEINVLNGPVELSLNEEFVRMQSHKSKSFTVDGKSPHGFHAYINPKDITWLEKGNTGQISNGIFTAAGEGMGYIEASVGNAKAYCALSVEADTFGYIDHFEKQNAQFRSYPSGLEGKFEISKEQRHTGSFSGKLTYDFSETTEGTRAAYVIFPNNGLTLQDDTKALGMWVYNVRENPSWLRAMVRDSSGKMNYVTFAERLNWTGWKYVEASLADIESPALLCRIYLVQISPIPDMGSIYIDDLSTSSVKRQDRIDIPENIKQGVQNQKDTSFIKNESYSRFTVFGVSRSPHNLLEKLLIKRYTERMNKYIGITGLVGKSTSILADKLDMQLITTGTGWHSLDIKGNRFIQLDISKNGIRTTNPEQWHWFIKKLDTAPGKNIFIFLPSSTDKFDDKFESDLFQKILTEHVTKRNKRIWVFLKGNENTTYNEKGVKYVITAGLDAEGITPDHPEPAKFVLVTAGKNDIALEFKSIIE